MKRRTHRRLAALVAAGSFLWLSSLLVAQEPASEPSPPSTEQQREADLSIEQAQLADRWDRLEQIASRLAELSAATDPHRADLLRKALAMAREKEVHLRFETIVNLLEKERYNVATKDQESLEAELQQLLELLLKENRAEELRSQQEWLRMQLKEVNRIIRLQRGVKARTEGGDDSDRLAEDQQKVGERTGKLADNIEAAKGGSPDGENSQGDESQAQEGKQSETQEEAGETSEEEAADDADANSDSEQAGESEGKPSAAGEQSDSSQAKESQDSQSGKGSQQDQQSQSSQGRSQKGESQQGQSQQGQSQQGQSQQGQSQQGQSQQGQSQQGQSQQGQPSEGGQQQQQQSSDPDENLRQRLRAAQENMYRAREKLEEAEQSGAVEEQEQALRELEEARAELERILRQLREEEMERTLTLLEARFRKMLEAQIEVYEGTVRLHTVPEDARDHDDEIEAGRLSRQEEAIVREADRALEILLEEGTSVAFPEAVTQMRADMQDVATRLIKIDVGEMTQGIEQDIIDQLEESIEVLQKALEDLEKSKGSPQQGSPGEPQDPALVDKIEELKMIRALQMRINGRTQRYYEMIGGSGTDDPELLLALRQLAQRQERVYEATRDLHLGRNR